jgi:hypothetical protein
MLNALLTIAATFAIAAGLIVAVTFARRATRQRQRRARLGTVPGFTLRAPHGPQAVRKGAAANG